MSRPTKLSDAAISEHLSTTPDWKRSAADIPTIEREFTASNFAAALGFVNAVGVCAEVADHHPDILLHGWNKVRITLSTHDQGGLTELDFVLAKKIDELHF
jgi:4a-hydroxytetrahydrobiopterin dehydratase